MPVRILKSQRSMGLHYSTIERKMHWPVGAAPAVSFGFGFVLFVAVGVVSVNRPPVAQPVMVGRVSRDDVECMRLHRSADFTAIEVGIGTPPRAIFIRFRIGEVVASREESLHIYGTRIAESNSLYCSDTANKTCHDIALVSRRGPSGWLDRIVVQFRYDPPYLAPRSGLRLGMEGDLYPIRGYNYQLTSTHICVAPWDAHRDTHSATNVLVGRIENALPTQSGVAVARITTDASAIMKVHTSILGKAAVHQELTNEHSVCVGILDAVHLFPAAAADAVGYLALADPHAHGEQLALRRHVVELGDPCATQLIEAYIANDDRAAASRIVAALNLYQLSGIPMSTTNGASLPFKHVSNFDVMAQYGANKSNTVRFVFSAHARVLP